MAQEDVHPQKPGLLVSELRDKAASFTRAVEEVQDLTAEAESKYLEVETLWLEIRQKVKEVEKNFEFLDTMVANVPTFSLPRRLEETQQALREEAVRPIHDDSPPFPFDDLRDMA